MARALDLYGQLTLLFLGQTSFDPRHDHALTRDEVFEHLDIFVTKNIFVINC